MSQNLDLDPFWWEAAPRRELEEKPLPTDTDVANVLRSALFDIVLAQFSHRSGFLLLCLFRFS